MAQEKVALLIVDVQHDFLPPSGSLAVPEGDAILPLIYRMLEDDRWTVVALSEDHHPRNHVSFASNHGKAPLEKTVVPAPWRTDGEGVEQVLWPDHCVQGTRGAETEAGVVARLKRWDERGKSFTVRKGKDPAVDAYSAFAPESAPMPAPGNPSKLTEFLHSRGVTTVATVGLATDYCVRATAVHALEEGFGVWWIADAMKAVGGAAAEEAVKEELRKRGAKVATGAEALEALGSGA